MVDTIENWHGTRKTAQYGDGDNERIHLVRRRFDGLQTGVKSKPIVGDRYG